MDVQIGKEQVLQVFLGGSRLDHGIVHDVVYAADTDPGSSLKTLLLMDADHPLSVIRDEVQAGRKLMVVLRGLPGSGKTTLAKCIALACSEELDKAPQLELDPDTEPWYPEGFEEKDEDSEWKVAKASQRKQNKGNRRKQQKAVTGPLSVSADDYFIDKKGQYVYVRELIGKAHEYSQSRARKGMSSGRTPVIVDNTNLQSWEMLPYLKLARESNYTCILLEPHTSWAKKPFELARKTQHGVPMAKIKQMHDNARLDLSLEDIVSGTAPALRPNITTIDQLKAGRSLTSPTQQQKPVRAENPLPAASALSGNAVTRSVFDTASPSFNPLTHTPQNANQANCVSQSNASLRALLDCFPNMDVEDLLPAFFQSGGAIEDAVDIVLSQGPNSLNGAGGGSSTNSASSTGSSSSPSLSRRAPSSASSNDLRKASHELTLDAEFATHLEAAYGPVRRTNRFGPGQQSFPVPPSLASTLHALWRQEVARKSQMDDAEAARYLTKKLTLDSKRKSAAGVLIGSRGLAPPPGLAGPSGQKISPSSSFENFENYGDSVPVSRQTLQQLEEKRHDMFHQAARWHQDRNGAVAGYYADEGRKLQNKIMAMKADVSFHEFCKRNLERGKDDSVDLHGLSVAEAEENLEWWLNQKRARIVGPNGKTLRLEVITGRGSRGTPKLKPRIKKYLDNCPFATWKEKENPGAFEVVIRK